MSIVRGRYFGGGRFADLAASSTAAASSAVPERAPAAMNDAPAFAYARTIARPIPRDPPVMSTAFPERSSLVGSISG